jgi:hypothetical protein
VKYADSICLTVLEDYAGYSVSRVNENMNSRCEQDLMVLCVGFHIAQHDILATMLCSTYLHI